MVPSQTKAAGAIRDWDNNQLWRTVVRKGREAIASSSVKEAGQDFAPSVAGPDDAYRQRLRTKYPVCLHPYGPDMPRQ